MEEARLFQKQLKERLQDMILLRNSGDSCLQDDPRREADHSNSSSEEAKNICSLISRPQHA